MKKAAVILKFDQEKLAAARRYMAQKGLSPESEFQKLFEKLYEKYVPSPVQDYIAGKGQEAADAAQFPFLVPEKAEGSEIDGQEE